MAKFGGRAPRPKEACASLQEIRLLLDDAGVERLELEPAGERVAHDFERLRGGFRRNLFQGLAIFKRRLGDELHLARPLHGDEPPYRLIDRASDRNQAVALQDRRFALADRIGYPPAVVELDRHT